MDDSALSMFQAVPALKKIEIGCDDGIPGAKAALRIIIKAIREGTQQQLEEVTLRNFTLGEGDVKGFLGTLEDFGYAERLVYLGFEGCHVNIPKGFGFLAELLGRDAFPALETLEMSGTPLYDEGVVALAKGLLRARQTVLTNLVLKNVGMADEGMPALASLVSQGLMEELEMLDISKNKKLTHECFRCLARAIDKHGLPILETFQMQKFGDRRLDTMCAITLALIKGCPRLKEIDFTDTGTRNYARGGCPDHSRIAIKGLLDAAGRVEEISVIYDREDGDVETDEDI